MPQEAQADPPDNRVIAAPTSRIEMGETVGSKKLKLTKKKAADALVFNTEDNTIEIQGTASITIRAVGAINLEAPQTAIGGRVVWPVADTI